MSEKIRLSPLTQAWKSLVFECQVGQNRESRNVSEIIEPCKLQHVFTVKFAERSFLTNVSLGIKLYIISPGRIGIDAKFNKSEDPWEFIMLEIHRALKDLECVPLTFDSMGALETVVEKLQEKHSEVLSSKDVGLYAHSFEGKIIVKFVGPKREVTMLTEIAKESITQLNTHVGLTESELKVPVEFTESHRNRNTVFRQERFPHYAIEYIEATGFKKNFSEKFDDLTLEDCKNQPILKMWGPSDGRLEQGFQFIRSFISFARTSVLDLPDSEISFVRCKHVNEYLKSILREVSAYFVVDQCVTIYAPDEAILTTGMQVFHDHIQRLNVSGSWPQAADTIIKSCHGKIVCNSGEEAMTEILFTKDCKTEAEKLRNMISKRIQEDKQYEMWKIRAFVMFDVLSQLQDLLPDVDIQLIEKQLTIRFQSTSKEKVCLATKEVDSYMDCIMKFEPCPEGANELMKRKSVKEYAMGVLNAIKVGTIVDENRVISIVYLAKSLKGPKVKDLFLVTKMLKNKLEGQIEAGIKFLEENSAKIFRKDINTKLVYLCMTLDLKSEFESHITYTRKTLHKAVLNFLKKFGSGLLGSLEKRHSVRLKIENEHVYCFGDENCGNKCLEELETSMSFSVAHFANGDNSTEIYRSRKDITDITDEIANELNVGIDVFDSCEPCLTDDREKGKQYFAKWTLENNKEKVAVADVDFTTDTSIDVVVIPVNECCFGKDIFGGRNVNICYDDPTKRYRTGSRKIWKCESNKAVKYCVVLVIEEGGMSNTVQERKSIDSKKLLKSFTEIFSEIVKNNFSQISVVVPQENQVITSNVKIILEAFRKICGRNTNSELLFCLKEDPEELIKMVDRSILSRGNTRREVSSTFAGLFLKPKVKTSVVKESLLEVGARCHVVLVSKDVNLQNGHVSSLVSEKAGAQLQTYLKSKVKTPLKIGELVTSDSFQLKESGVLKLIFGYLPFWKKLPEITVLEKFVEDCLLMAESMCCTSVAFPALGTGNLAYPPREVVGAMLDGISKYAAETIIGTLEEVIIAAPTIKNSNLLYELLIKEQTKREKEQSILPKRFHDVPYLVTKNGNMLYRVVKKTHIDVFSSVKTVTVVIEPGAVAPPKVTPWEIQIFSEPSKGSLSIKMADVIKGCDGEKISSIIVLTKKDCEISQQDQVDVIIGAAQQENEVAELHYLKDVIVAIEDQIFDDHTKSKLEEGDMKHSKRKGPGLTWKKQFVPHNQKAIDIVIAGDKIEQVRTAKKKIQELFKPEEIVLIGNEEQDEEPGVGPDLEAMFDKVSAEINPGIINYLRSLPNGYYHNWKVQIQELYRIDIDDKPDQHGVSISGTFQNILKMETYLEETFPAMPSTTEKHFGNSVADDEKKSSRQKIPKSDQDLSLYPMNFGFKTANLQVVLMQTDITDFNEGCIASEIGSSISKRIAEKAGERFNDELKALIDDARKHDVGTCIYTDRGDLSCSKVLHVFCPRDFLQEAKQTFPDLKSLMLRCLMTADEHKEESIALPFLCADFRDYYWLGRFVNEYFDGLMEFNTSKSLKRIFLLDLDVENVNYAIEILANCIEKRQPILDTTASLSILSAEQCINVHVAKGTVIDVSVDAIVIAEDVSFTSQNRVSKYIYETAGPRFQQKFGELASKPHKITDVEFIGSLENLTCKAVLLAVPPQWEKKEKLFAEKTAETVSRVVSKVSSLKHIEKIALSPFYLGGPKVIVQPIIFICAETATRSIIKQENALQPFEEIKKMGKRNKNKTGVRH